MAGPVSGEWGRQYTTPYSGARVWGTGINPVHAHYGSFPLRVGGLSQREGEPGGITPPFAATTELLIPHDLWGYSLEDSLYTGMDYDDRPPLNSDITHFRADVDNMPSWAAGGGIVSRFRSLRNGAHRTFRSRSPIPGHMQYQEPTETVSEGWLNKAHGIAANAKPSDDSQLTRQTSMQQRYQTRVNDAAVARGTDVPRTGIASLVTGQKLKVYSEGQRKYDMYPRQQDTIPRAFWYRSAGVGRRADMIPNTMYTIQPLERIPPPEPALGVPETGVVSEYGYTSEDHFYA